MAQAPRRPAGDDARVGAAPACGSRRVPRRAASTASSSGSCGLHFRIGAGGAEIGYRIHPAHTRRGLATEVARQLCERAFSDPAIDRVEIHHDRANTASGGVPPKLGFELIGDTQVAPVAPGEEGVERVWRLTRGDWEPLLPARR